MVRKSFKWYAGGFWLPHIHLNRTYRDHLFRFLFKDKRDLLELYNALNGSDYRDPNALEIVTLEDVIFLKMKNDLSFIIGDRLNLYEHQSTKNPNMPLCGDFSTSPASTRAWWRRESGVCMETRWFPFPHPSMWYSTMERRSWRTRLPCISPTPFRKGGAADVWSAVACC